MLVKGLFYVKLTFIGFLTIVQELYFKMLWILLVYLSEKNMGFFGRMALEVFQEIVM